MLITTGISVFTSRAVLEILGVIDFGIYNVVGGIVIVLGFVNGSLAGASTRFLTYAIGAGDKDKEKTYIFHSVDYPQKRSFVFGSHN